jgi:hypothetical protein
MPSKKPTVKADTDPLELLRQIGDEVLAEVLKDIAEGKFPAKKKKPARRCVNGIPVIHNDDDREAEKASVDAVAPAKPLKRKLAAPKQPKPKDK